MEKKPKTVWGIVLKVIIAVASAIAGAFGVSACAGCEIGYHFYITRDGEVHRCRPVHHIGAHAAGWNDHSIGICYEGGLDESGRPADTRTYAQKCALLDLLRQLKTDYPHARILGHRQLSPYIRKDCPCFDAAEEYAEV